MVLVDEAYYHFCGETVMDLVGKVPNLIVARTFSKAYGLAGLRLGMLAAPVGMQQWLRTVISPYSVNSLALACLPAALDDDAYLQWYVEEVKAARTEMVESLRQLGVPQWPSQANFILVKIGPRHAEFVQAMHRRGVLTRDRSKDQGCDGCVRLTVGTRDQMRQAVSCHGGSAERDRVGESMMAKKKAVSQKKRQAAIERKTTETKISLKLVVEGSGRYKVKTGIRFFDHMLELFTRHGAFDLELHLRRRSGRRPAPHSGRCRHRPGRGIRPGAGR